MAKGLSELVEQQGRWMDKWGYPIRTTRDLFMGKPELLTVLGMPYVPSRDWFHGALRMVRERTTLPNVVVEGA